MLGLCPYVFAASIVDEINRVAQDVESLGLGFDGYVLGKTLTAELKSASEGNLIEKTIKGTYKFKDGEVFVIASIENDRVLGVYKEYKEVMQDKVKEVVGGLMFEHGEPTAMAHDKLVYWTYDKNGKIEKDAFDFARQNGGAKSLAAVKFSSNEPIAFADGSTTSTETEQKKISFYVMITSDPLSTLFLAYSGASKVSGN